MAAQSHQRIETLIVNTSGSSRFFPFLTKLGKTLAANGTATVPGDIRAGMKERDLASLEAAVTAGSLAYFVNTRKIVQCAADSGTILAVNDMVYLDTDDVKPLLSHDAGNDEDATRVTVQNKFYGICLTAKSAGAAKIVQVDISPETVYFYPCVSATHEVNAIMGADADSDNVDKIVSNKLKVVSAADQAIAKCVRRDTSASTRVMVTFHSIGIGANAAASL